MQKKRKKENNTSQNIIKLSSRKKDKERGSGLMSRLVV